MLGPVDGLEDLLQDGEMVLAGHDGLDPGADLEREGRVGDDDPIAVPEGRQIVGQRLRPGGALAAWAYDHGVSLLFRVVLPIAGDDAGEQDGDPDDRRSIVRMGFLLVPRSHSARSR